ncbi:MAG: ferritin [Fusobacteria bacterium]|nr:ferritin [Fusobacteriota bacterium]
MLSEKMQKALNEHLDREMFSSYLYLSMSAYCAKDNLKGFSNWLKIQYQEEMAHFDFIYDYILKRFGTVELGAIEKPKKVWNDIRELFNEVLEHERFISKSINNLVSLAKEEKDFTTDTFLGWFVGEQAEEESNVDEVIGNLSFIDGRGPALLMLDREMATRVFVAPILA